MKMNMISTKAKKSRALQNAPGNSGISRQAAGQYKTTSDETR